MAEVWSPGFSRHDPAPAKAGTPNPEPQFRDLSIALVDDAAIADINHRFLNHTGPTDVISFNLGGSTGEIIVSAERAVIVARQLRRKPSDELALYLVHGLLHLTGMDDRTSTQRRAMRAAERRVLRQSKIQNPKSKIACR